MYSQFPQPIQTRPTSTPPTLPGAAGGADAAEYPPGSMSFINLNIDEYRVQDLEAFFMLPTKNYDIQDVVHKKKTMCAAADRDGTLTQATRTNLNTFLDQALARIIQHLHPIGSGKPITALPQNILSGDNGHFIINNPARDGVKNYDSSSKTGINLDDNGAPPGTMNPLKVNTIKRAVNIDTRFRPNYYITKSSDLQINLPTKVERAVSMRLASIEIPMSFYAISADFGNNVFKVSWNSGGVDDASSALITISDGNYDIGLSDKTKAARLETEINERLAATEAGVATVGKLNLRYEVNPITGKSRFYQDASATLVPTPISYKINFMANSAGVVLPVGENPLPLQGTLGWILGFRAASGEYSSTATGANGKIISEGICNIQAESTESRSR